MFLRAAESGAVLFLARPASAFPAHGLLAAGHFRRICSGRISDPPLRCPRSQPLRRYHQPQFAEHGPVRRRLSGLFRSHGSHRLNYGQRAFLVQSQRLRRFLLLIQPDCAHNLFLRRSRHRLQRRHQKYLLHDLHRPADRTGQPQRLSETGTLFSAEIQSRDRLH